ncbi:ABC transporter ATP-binding protein [Solihabitans fulvus]|uniref:ABC transporter ATP-binding protein n=1 Tax=Solihabitans fulvus TaxID=1892852 RepID=A0A5B2WVX8_9PSEU|nr:ABC transporter ATP-binding protein [Solihabitans fulvus]KAA2256123.1 ABC transporter ATP-binding protein [Solihabitans fulvus]
MTSPRTWALRDCTFEVPAGRVVALVGANGAGKSTLLGILGGVLAASDGAAEVTGRTAIVTQERPLYRHFSVADTLRLGASLNREWDQERALRWLNRFEVPLRRACGRLSGGQRAQVAIAVALGSRPSVLLLDEPLTNLDPLARRDAVRQLLTDVADTGLTVVLSTHLVAELSGVADHLVLLSRGRLVVDGDVDDLLAAHVEWIGPRADAPPAPGEVVHAQHTDVQSTFLVRSLADAAPPPPGWLCRQVPLEDFVLAHLASGRNAVADKEKAA